MSFGSQLLLPLLFFNLHQHIINVTKLVKSPTTSAHEWSGMCSIAAALCDRDKIAATIIIPIVTPCAHTRA
jgi:hypothetical protein